MSEREYDILLAETAGSLPPGPSEQSEPWRVAMRRILWGLALVTIKLELLGLNYLLPCLGAALVYLGFRSLRRSAPGFRLGWLVSIVLLVSAAASAVLAAAKPVQSPDWLHWPLVALNFARDMCLLLGLRAGILCADEDLIGHSFCISCTAPVHNCCFAHNQYLVFLSIFRRKLSADRWFFRG